MIASLALAIAIVYFGLLRFVNGADNSTVASQKERVVAWILLLFAISIPPLFATSPTELPHNIAITLFAITCMLFFHGWRPTLWMSPALIIFCLFIPMREQFILMISYPLRLISTALSVCVLKLLQVNIEYHLTTITMPGAAQIVITDACSGIEQLEAMLLIGYLIIHMQPKPFIWSLCHYLFLLPIIIVSNSVRIVVTILLYKAVGPVILENTWHTTLGYCLVFACSILIWYAGLLFTAETPVPLSPENARPSDIPPANRASNHE
jgi:exosortase/archaeosortase family protein